jgi:hypothetical protein
MKALKENCLKNKTALPLKSMFKKKASCKLITGGFLFLYILIVIQSLWKVGFKGTVADGNSCTAGIFNGSAESTFYYMCGSIVYSKVNT